MAGSTANMVGTDAPALGDRVVEAARKAGESGTADPHYLLARESVTSPDEARGRESVLSYVAVVSAV